MASRFALRAFAILVATAASFAFASAIRSNDQRRRTRPNRQVQTVENRGGVRL